MTSRLFLRPVASRVFLSSTRLALDATRAGHLCFAGCDSYDGWRCGVTSGRGPGQAPAAASLPRPIHFTAVPAAERSAVCDTPLPPRVPRASAERLTLAGLACLR